MCTDYWTVRSEIAWSIDHLITSIIQATIRSPLYKDMTSHSIYKVSWKNMTSICTQLKKKSQFSRCNEQESMTVRATWVPSFNRTYSLRGQNVGGHIVYQYFGRIHIWTLIFSLSSRFRGKIISTVLELFCLSWAISVRRDASERDSSKALTIKRLHAVVGKLRILDCWCFEQQLAQHYESKNRDQKKLKIKFLKNLLTWTRTWLVTQTWLGLKLDLCYK